MSQNIIRSYLVSLGFKTNTTELKKFTDTLGKVDKTSKGVSAGVAGIAVAAQVMVATFSNQMEKLYYASQRTKASATNIKALEYGAQQVGIQAGAATESLEKMAASVRMNPGLRGLMNRIVGKDTAGMDQSVAMLEMVQKLGSMPHFQGARFAQMFGMDEQTFLMLVDKAPELIASIQRFNDVNKASGVDQEKAAAAGREYSNSIRDIKTQIDLLIAQLSIELLPVFRDLNKEVLTGLQGLTEFVKTLNSGKGTEMTSWLDDELSTLKTFGEMLSHVGGMWNSLFKAGGRKEFGEHWQAIQDIRAASDARWEAQKKAKASGGAAPVAAKGAGTSPNWNWQNPSRVAAKRKGGDPVLVWSPEDQAADDASETANRDSNIAQLKKELAKKNLNKMQRDTLQEELGRQEAYKLGGGNSAATGATTGVTINQKTDIHVNGVSDPKAAGNEVLRGQSRVTGDLSRNLAGAVR